MRAQLDDPSTGARREPRAASAAARRPVFERAEVRDVLAWLRLLIEPRDAAAAVRALGRPPVELRQVDLARVVQIARRRRLDVVSALGTASESPQLAPQARERIERFQELHEWATAALEEEPAEVFVGSLIERLGLRRRQLFAADARDVEERVAGLERLCELAEDFGRRSPRSGARALAAHLVAQARTDTTPPADAASHLDTRPDIDTRPDTDTRPDIDTTTDLDPALGLDPGRLLDTTAQSEARPDTEEQALRETLGLLREEVLGDVTRIAGRLGELRLDTDLDVSHGVVRYLELIKLAALAERTRGRERGGRAGGHQRAAAGGDDAAAAGDLRELAAGRGLVADAERAARGEADAAGGALAGGALPGALRARGEPSLEAFLPRRGEGLALSASDVETYRGCPLRYKFGRVLRIPTEQTLGQRFGIVVHQVLERYHSAEEQTLGSDDGAAGGGVAAVGHRRGRAGAPAAGEGAGGVGALPRAPARGAGAAAVVRALVRVRPWARTTCAGGSIAWTRSRTEATS